MRADFDERLERLIVSSDAAHGFELLKNKILQSVGDISPRNITINNPSWINMMSSSASQDVRQPMMKEK